MVLVEYISSLECMLSGYLDRDPEIEDVVSILNPGETAAGFMVACLRSFDTQEADDLTGYIIDYWTHSPASPSGDIRSIHYNAEEFLIQQGMQLPYEDRKGKSVFCPTPVEITYNAFFALVNEEYPLKRRTDLIRNNLNLGHPYISYSHEDKLFSVEQSEDRGRWYEFKSVNVLAELFFKNDKEKLAFLDDIAKAIREIRNKVD